MTYEEPSSIAREAAVVELASGDWERISVALLRLALHDPDAAWLEATFLPYLRHSHHWVRGVAAMCLGHVARIHGVLDTEGAVPAISLLLGDEDPGTRGKAQDALDDIELFVGRRHSDPR